jgi:hypothetical protein
MIIDADDILLVKNVLSYPKIRERKYFMDKVIRNVVDNDIDLLVSQRAYNLASSIPLLKGIDLSLIKWGKWPSGCKNLFADGNKGINSKTKIFHFEHDIPVGVVMSKLFDLDLTSDTIDNGIKAIFYNSNKWIITEKEDCELNEGNKKGIFAGLPNKSWKSEFRPINAYELLGIKKH